MSSTLFFRLWCPPGWGEIIVGGRYASLHGVAATTTSAIVSYSRTTSHWSFGWETFDTPLGLHVIIQDLRKSNSWRGLGRNVEKSSIKKFIQVIRPWPIVVLTTGVTDELSKLLQDLNIISEQLISVLKTNYTLEVNVLCYNANLSSWPVGLQKLTTYS